MWLVQPKPFLDELNLMSKEWQLYGVLLQSLDQSSLAQLWQIRNHLSWAFQANAFSEKLNMH
jgi:hypothetical protein